MPNFPWNSSLVILTKSSFIFGDNIFIKQKKSRIAPPEMSGQCGFSFSISFLRSGLPVIHTKTWWGSLIPRSDKSHGWNVHWKLQANFMTWGIIQRDYHFKVPNVEVPWDRYILLYVSLPILHLSIL